MAKFCDQSSIEAFHKKNWPVPKVRPKLKIT